MKPETRTLYGDYLDWMRQWGDECVNLMRTRLHADD